MSMEALLPQWADVRVGYAVIALIAYTSLCNSLRFRRIHALERKYGFGGSTKRSLSEMTDREAWEIQTDIAELEFPALFEKALQLALFRTYGIPSISKLLVQTAQLSTSENVAKRYADTAVILLEMYGSAPDDKKGIEAFSRLNYLHGHYLKQGRITNDDMLYTLALFMNHPREWIDRYEWRTLTDMEVCAIATFHKCMGDAMNIKFDVLPGSKTGWKDGLQFYQELDAWAKAYEARCMVPHKDNYNTAIKTKDLLLSTVPASSHSLVGQLVSAAMDDRLREAIMFAPARPIVRTALNAFMATRKFMLRHFALPRLFDWQRKKTLDTRIGPDGRRWVKIWSTTPHYVRPTLWERWGPGGWYQLMLGQPRAGDQGMCPEGYVRSNVGPRSFDGKGQAEFESEQQEVIIRRPGGCPFARAK